MIPTLIGLELLVMFLACFVLVWFKRLPDLHSFVTLLDALNTRGGNIFILVVLTVLSGGASIRMFYYVIELSRNGNIQQDNVYTIQAIGWLSTGLTGGFIGALLKTMTGESSPNANPTVMTTTVRQDPSTTTVTNKGSL